MVTHPAVCDSRAGYSRGDHTPQRSFEKAEASGNVPDAVPRGNGLKSKPGVLKNLASALLPRPAYQRAGARTTPVRIAT